jgi:hypothetical protein
MAMIAQSLEMQQKNLDVTLSPKIQGSFRSRKLPLNHTFKDDRFKLLFTLLKN